jgi:hypothetical protein
MVINNHANLIHDTTHIHNGSWTRAICHSSEDRPLLYVDTTQARQFMEISRSDFPKLI